MVKRRMRMRASTRLFGSVLQKQDTLGLAKLKLCVYDAVSYFNYGALIIIDTLKLLGIDAGRYTLKSAVDANIQRHYNAGYKAKTTSMKRRNVIRGLKKEKGDNIKKQEGIMYEAGGF